MCYLHHPCVGDQTSHSGDENWVIGADPGVRGIRILRAIWIPGDGVNTGLTRKLQKGSLGDMKGNPITTSF